MTEANTYIPTNTIYLILPVR